MKKIFRLFGIITLTAFIFAGCSTYMPQVQDNILTHTTEHRTEASTQDEYTAGTSASTESGSEETTGQSNIMSGNTGEIIISQGINTFTVNLVSDYTGTPYTIINNNVPFFTDDELTIVSYEFYSELDDLDRCGYTIACIGQDIMPTEERGNIGNVKPTGWHTVKYDCVNGKYLYNRCHLIGFQLTGENANECNLITGTRYLNVDGMLPFENMVADYVKETGNHVMYRVTPIFDGDNLVADGVLMEARSVEDDGEGILFNVYCYNVQPGVIIDYATGESRLDDGSD